MQLDINRIATYSFSKLKDMLVEIFIHTSMEPISQAYILVPTPLVEILNK